jgi:hypothetical protein
MDNLQSDLAGRSPGRPAIFTDVLLYRGTSADGADCLVTFDKRTLLMSRSVAGLACRIRIPVRQFQAVALMVRDRGHVIRLMHRDAGLTLDIEEFESFATAEEYGDRLADFLGLPAVTVAGSPGEDETPSADHSEARRSRGVRARRPRFLARRRSGSPLTFEKIEGHEIIARH